MHPTCVFFIDFLQSSRFCWGRQCGAGIDGKAEGHKLYFQIGLVCFAVSDGVICNFCNNHTWSCELCISYESLTSYHDEGCDSKRVIGWVPE